MSQTTPRRELQRIPTGDSAENPQNTIVTRRPSSRRCMRTNVDLICFDTSPMYARQRLGQRTTNIAGEPQMAETIFMSDRLKRNPRGNGIVHSIKLCMSKNMKRKISQLKSSIIRILTVKLSDKKSVCSMKLSIPVRKGIKRQSGSADNRHPTANLELGCIFIRGLSTCAVTAIVRNVRGAELSSSFPKSASLPCPLGEPTALVLVKEEANSRKT